MRKRIRVNVTEEHLRLGDRRKESSCPIALALKDAGINMQPLGNCNDPITLPRSVREYIRKFDLGGPRHGAPKYFYLDADEVRLYRSSAEH